jgi:two-component system nitrate/nitrite response regulator NarL
MTPLKVLIAEDHAITAKLLARMIGDSPDIEVVGIANNGVETIEFIINHDVDIILLDLTMPIMDVFQVMEIIFKTNPKIRALVLSGHSEPQIIQRSLDFGASGYLIKTVSIEEVISALITINKGENYIDEESLRTLIESNITNIDDTYHFRNLN